MNKNRTSFTQPARAPARLHPKAAALAVAACFGGAALANPTNPTVVHGTATFQQAGNILNITNSPSAIINWGSFSISAGELTRFIQQSASSAVLNRVIGQDPSAILGALQSNGRVFLLNPNGIVFGAGAQIDVAGLVASTLNLSNEDFLNNRLRFTDGAGAGSVINQGQITGGSVYLVGKAVTNDGLITSPNGEVILAAGNSVELVNPGTPNLRVEVTAPDNEAKNLGTISAEAGRIGIYAGLIGNSGTINASSAMVEGGRILLKAAKNVNVAAAGKITASGTGGGVIDIQAGDTTLVEGEIAATGSSGTGGTVHVLGDKVGLIGHARIDASGETGGGTVLVGGDYQGANPGIDNAFRSHVGKDVKIHADAITEGDGGKVIVWADDITRFYGNISARGGAQGGDGGFAEVSGKRMLDFQGAANLGAARGATGTLLLDPENIDIDATSGLLSGLLETLLGTLGAGTLTDGELLFTEAPGATIAIHPSVLNASTANIVLQANDTINVNDPVFLANNGVGITLEAGGYLNVNGSITTRSGAITLVSGAGSPTPQNEGSLNINAGLDSTGAGANPGGADIRLTANLSDVGGNSVYINAPVNAGSAGNVIINDSNANIEQTVLGAITAHGLAANATNGNVILNTANNQVDHFAAFAGHAVIDQNRQVLFKNTRNLSLETVGSLSGIVASASTSYGGTVNLDLGSNALTRSGAAPIRVEGDSTSNITISAGSIGQSGAGNFMDIDPAAGAGTVNLTVTAGGIHVNQMAGSGNLRLNRYAASAPAGQMVALASSGGHLNVGDGSAGSAFNFSVGSAELMLATVGAHDIVFANAYGGSISAAKLYLAPEPGEMVLFPAITSGSWTINPLTELFDQNRSMHINGATVTFAGGLDASSNVLLNSGGLSFGAASNFTGLSVSSGALGGSGALDIDNFSISGGTTNNGGNIVVNDLLNWSGGTIGGSGTLSTPGTATTDITALVGLAPGKTWNNAGTVNIGGTGTLDLGDSTAAIFNNQAGGVVNITSTAGWSFISDSFSQAGQINNAGTINVNNGTSWEAAFNNAAGATLNIAAGQYLSMQNGKTINGTVNIGAGGTLWVSEFHASPTVFSGTTIGGTGTLQVLGSGPNVKFTSVSAPGVALRLGGGGNIEILNGTSTFAALNLDAPSYGGAFAISNGLFAQSAGDLTVPTGSDYSGNAGYWAQGGNVIVGGVVDAAYGGATIEFRASGDVKILGGADVSGVQVKLQGANIFVGDSAATSAASVYASSQLDVITGGLVLQGGSGANASALVSSSGALTVSASGDVVLAGGAGADSWAKLSGNPDAVLSPVGGAVRMTAGTGANAYAIIESVSPTTIYLTFPNAGSGGFFVNGVEGVVYDAGTHTGFVAGGNPAVLGQNLKVTYGGSSTTLPSGTLELPVQTLIVATGQSKDPPDAEKDKDVFRETEEEKKKDVPVCR
ncbi:MAG: filamentous hemagglutinin N-terminal domain-containing protein [Burkholderiales bacterium]|nr:filamentous hemagglutinin N-terminal domain-containing protein [Burkholderiales bacterium]